MTLSEKIKELYEYIEKFARKNKIPMDFIKAMDFIEIEHDIEQLEKQIINNQNKFDKAYSKQFDECNVLKQQIEKRKCCCNCKGQIDYYCKYGEGFSEDCKYNNYCEWELAE